MHRALALSAILAATLPAAASDAPGRTLTIYVQQAFPKQETTNAQIEEINDLLGTSFDTWDDVVNLSLGAQLFWGVRDWLDVGIEVDLARGGIEGSETVAGGLRADFEQIYDVYANLLVAGHVKPCPGCERVVPFILWGAGAGYERDTTRLRLHGGGVDERLVVDNDGIFPAVTAGVGIDVPLRGGPWYLQAGTAYYWGRLKHDVRAEGSLAPSPFVLADNDSSGPNYWIGVGRSF